MPFLLLSNYAINNWQPSATSATPSRLPFASTIAAVICLVGLSLFVAKFFDAVEKCLYMLENFFFRKREDLEFLDEYRRNFTFLTAISVVVVFMVVLIDFLRKDALFAENPICLHCNGTIPILVVSKYQLLYSISDRMINTIFGIAHDRTNCYGRHVDLCVLQSGTDVLCVLHILLGVRICTRSKKI